MTAQWDDDIHHAIHTAVSGERQGYYRDFGSLQTLAQTLTHGYFHAGTYSSFRHRRHGRPLDITAIPATRLLAYTLTHDQVGNRAVGDRPSQNLTFGQLAVKAALALGSPYTAMLFMGEEWGIVEPVPVLQLTPGARVGPGHRRGPQGRVRRARVGCRRDPRPPGPGHLRAVQAELGRADHRRARPPAGALPRPDRLAAPRTRLRRPVADPSARRLRRGCPLDRHVPRRAGGGLQPRHRRGDGSGGRDHGAGIRHPRPGRLRTRLPGQSFAVLRSTD